MAEEIKVAEATQEQAEKTPAKSEDFKFFKNCSSSLKRFSIIIFVVNIFLSIGVTGVALLFITVKVGFDMLTILALPIITAFVILIVIARFISALIYGFAEIVEKSEKK